MNFVAIDFETANSDPTSLVQLEWLLSAMALLLISFIHCFAL